MKMNENAGEQDASELHEDIYVDQNESKQEDEIGFYEDLSSQEE